MKNLNELKKQYEKLGKEIERLENGVDWVPEISETIYVVGTSGIVYNHHFEGFEIKECFNNHTIYQEKHQAQKAARLMKRSNAIIRACILVDPDYEPEWSRYYYKWSIYYNNCADCWRVNRYNKDQHCVAHVSTEEKAQQVCELLTKWGVK